MALLGPKAQSTQDHLDIEDIKDDLAVCKNGQVSLVLETTAVNFDLLSEREQTLQLKVYYQKMQLLCFYLSYSFYILLF